eukprot:NODE_3322_length_999_cov_9.678947_g3055_i0.p1 GENE.NODE_3322_length_999_cov_9.678947_g3055_i0~~NODE_3322_length_999_cov_9.678947_g3055_i0.p1  ORF type:complete len:247 (+),score=43.97 NODE_3322_length_999_cov_9.678947_g3055_i0:58-741(+)
MGNTNCNCEDTLQANDSNPSATGRKQCHDILVLTNLSAKHLTLSGKKSAASPVLCAGVAVGLDYRLTNPRITMKDERGLSCQWASRLEIMMAPTQSICYLSLLDVSDGLGDCWGDCSWALDMATVPVEPQKMRLKSISGDFTVQVSRLRPGQGHGPAGNADPATFRGIQVTERLAQKLKTAATKNPKVRCGQAGEDGASSAASSTQRKRSKTSSVPGAGEEKKAKRV